MAGGLVLVIIVVLGLKYMSHAAKEIKADEEKELMAKQERLNILFTNILRHKRRIVRTHYLLIVKAENEKKGIDYKQLEYVQWGGGGVELCSAPGPYVIALYGYVVCSRGAAGAGGRPNRWPNLALTNDIRPSDQSSRPDSQLLFWCGLISLLTAFPQLMHKPESLAAGHVHVF